MMLSKLHAFNGSQVAAAGYCRFYQIWMEPYGKRLLLVNIKVSDVITTHHHHLRVKQFLAVPKSGDEWKQLGLLRKWQITVIAQRQPLTSDKHPEGEADGAMLVRVYTNTVPLVGSRCRHFPFVSIFRPSKPFSMQLLCRDSVLQNLFPTPVQTLTSDRRKSVAHAGPLVI